jgi:Transposase
MYLGWDRASQRHDVTVIDDTGQLVDRWRLAHTEAGIHQAMTRLAGHGRPDDLPVAIEATSGIVVDRLLAAGHPVVRPRPNSFNAARPRWGASKATSDPGDSFKLAEDLCTDGHRLRRLPTHRCRHPEPAGHLAPAHRPPGGQDPCHHEAQRPAGGPLARRQGYLCPPGQRHRAGGPGARSDPAGRPAAGPGPPGRLSAPPRLQRPAHPSPAASPAAGRPGRGRPARSRGPGSTASASSSGCCAACLAASPTWIGP